METILLNLPTYMDYNWLSHALCSYASPRVKINRLLRNREIIRVKKGIYVPGEKYDRNISRGVLANLIYGPSYVSYEYALSWHGLVPERVYGIASACAKRKKEFTTPLGTFWYHKIPQQVFSLGVETVEDGERSFLMASPEKALADRFALEKRIHTMSDVEILLYDDLRFDSEMSLKGDLVKSIAGLYRKKSVCLLADHIESIGSKS